MISFFPSPPTHQLELYHVASFWEYKGGFHQNQQFLIYHPAPAKNEKIIKIILFLLLHNQDWCQKSAWSYTDLVPTHPWGPPGQISLYSLFTVDHDDALGRKALYCLSSIIERFGEGEKIYHGFPDIENPWGSRIID